ncbi:MAG: hypothetical protein WCJ72_08160 [Chryseobacterium sp.]
MPKVTSIKESHKKVRQKMEEVDCTYTFVASELQINTLSVCRQKNAIPRGFSGRSRKQGTSNR